jgi:hypothetical protein
MKSTWIALLEAKYKNLKAPNYSFVLDEIGKNPYAKVVEDIRRGFSINEDTDENTDISFGYVLSLAPGRDFLLRISMIAPYAFLAKIKERGSTSQPIVRENTQDAMELDVLKILESHGISMFDEKSLKIGVPDSGKDSKSLYQWMFVDEEIPP